MRFYLNDLGGGNENKSCLTESIRAAANLLRLHLQSGASAESSRTWKNP